MIKNLLFTFLLISVGIVLNAQEYSDDFEEYSTNSYIGVESENWTTWSGATGGAEDAQVVDTKAKSGTKSLFFTSTSSTGGPQDVLLLFGDKYTSGTFDLSFSIFVSEGAEAYYNFQEELSPGVTWAGNAWFRDGGVLTANAEANGSVLTTPFIEGEWNDIEYNIDLDNGEWIIKVNGNCIGTLLAPAAVATLDIYPLTSTGSGDFWIDDVSYLYQETAVSKSLDAALTNLAPDGAAFTGEMANLAANLTNTGSEMVNDVKITYSVDGGSSETQEYNDLDLAAGESISLEFPDAFETKQGNNVVSMAMSEINGFGADDIPCNNSIVTSITGITLTPNKRVVVEEATGTWCPWCVRGTVFMERMGEKYGDRFVGIAVHNADPMAVTEYDSWLTTLTGGGWPNSTVDRNSTQDPSLIEGPIVSRLQQPINETFRIKASYDEDINEVVATVTVDAINELSASRRIVLVITEDDVTGSSSGYAQANAYAGGASGEMGGYEYLPSPVPASQMVYNEVARAILPTPNGMKIDEVIPAGGSATFTFGVELSSDVDLDNINLIAFIASPPPVRRIDNAFEISLEDAIANYVDTKETDIDVAFEIAPNPVSNLTNIRINIEQPSDVSLEIFSITGQKVQGRSYGKVQGDKIFMIDASNLNNGIYNVVISVDGYKTNQKIIVAH